MKFKRISIVFALILVVSTFFSSFASAELNNKLKLVALGDSITYGWNLQEDRTKPSPLAFPYLIGNGGSIVTQNISYPGWRSDELLTAINTPVGLAAFEDVDVITLNIGNNDLLQTPEVAAILNTLKNNPTAKIPQEQIDAATIAIFGPNGTAQKIGTNIGKIIEIIKKVNPNAIIFLYNMYNPYGAEIPSVHAIGEQIIPAINQNVIRPLAIRTGSRLIDAYSAFNGHQAEYILPGDIHPNPTGHVVLAGLAERIFPLLLEATPATTDPVQGSVTVNVATNAKEIAKLEWLPGEKTPDDFYSEDGGNPIADNKFEVKENGKYTVYLMDRREQERLVVIEITNITKDSQNPGGGNGDTPNPAPGSDGNDKPTPTPAPVDQNKDKPTPAPTSKINGKGHSLPNTATAMYNYLALGGILVLAGGAMMIKRRREN